MRKLNLSPRAENTRDPLIVKTPVQFELHEIKGHFDESLNAIRKQFDVAEYLLSVEKFKESENIYRSQIVFFRKHFRLFYARDN